MTVLYPLLPVLAGAGLLWWGLREFALLAELGERGVRVPGMVTGYQETGQSSRMVIEFRTSDGHDVRTTHSSAAWSAGRVGEPVTVAYDPSEPERARIVQGPWLSRAIHRLVAATGLALLLVGLVLAYLAWF